MRDFFRPEIKVHSLSFFSLLSVLAGSVAVSALSSLPPQGGIIEDDNVFDDMRAILALLVLD